MPSGLRLVRDEPGRIVLAHEQPFQIAETQFRPATREVIFAGETSIIEPRVMQLLVALHRAGGAVVSKDDLASLCWEGRVVGEDAINRVVSRARSVADKQAPGQFRIETITKVGYRLIGARETQAAQRHGEPASGRGLPRREMMIGGAGLTAVALAGLGWRVLNRQSTPPEAQALLDATRGWLCGTVDQTGNSVAQVHRAVQLAPNSAEAWGLLAFAYMRYAHAAPPDQRSDLASRGKVAMHRAFALEPNQPDALAAQLWTIPNYRNWVNFEAAARAALRLHPENTILGFALGMTLGQVGRLQEALPYIERTLAAYPMVPGNHVNFAMGLWDLGRLDDANSAVSKGFDLFPHNTGIWFTRLYFLLYNDRAAEAAAMLSDIDSVRAGFPNGITILRGCRSMQSRAATAAALAGRSRHGTRRPGAAPDSPKTGRSSPPSLATSTSASGFSTRFISIAASAWPIPISARRRAFTRAAIEARTGYSAGPTRRCGGIHVSQYSRGSSAWTTIGGAQNRAHLWSLNPKT